MVLLVMGTIDLARGYRMQIQLENAAGEGAAFARITPNDVNCTGDDITDAVLGEDPELASLDGFVIEVYGENSSGDVVVPITGCGGSTASAGERVRVDVIATFDVFTPFVEDVVGESIELTGSAEIEVQG